jgi:hypothetical protein
MPAVHHLAMVVATDMSRHPVSPLRRVKVRQVHGCAGQHHSHVGDPYGGLLLIDHSPNASGKYKVTLLRRRSK